VSWFAALAVGVAALVMNWSLALDVSGRHPVVRVVLAATGPQAKNWPSRSFRATA
jgi:hypothetical protein